MGNSEAIAGGGDLAEAKSQSAAIAKTKKALRSSVDAAEKASPGSGAVGLKPKIATGDAVASIPLLNGTTINTVPEALE